MPAEPKEDPECVGHDESQADVEAEPLRVMGPLDVQVLGDVRHHSAKYHGQLRS